MIFQQLINGLMLGATYSLVAIGYTLIFGVLGILHFAHGEVLMAGAFMGLYIILWSGLPLYISLPVTMVAAGILGVIIDLLAIKPLKKDFHLAPLLSTIGVTIIIQNLAIKLFGGYGTRFPDVIETSNFNLGTVSINATNVLDPHDLSVPHGRTLFFHLPDQDGQGHEGGCREPLDCRIPGRKRR